MCCSAPAQTAVPPSAATYLQHEDLGWAAQSGQAAHPAMAVVQANDELLEDPARLLLHQAPMRPMPHGVVEQVTPPCVLHDNGQMPPSQEHLQT